MNLQVVERALKNIAEYCEKHDVEVLVQESEKDVLLLDRLAMSRTLADVCQGLRGQLWLILSLPDEYKWFFKGSLYFSQTYAYVVELDDTFSSRLVWGPLMPPFISYDMKNEANRGFVLWKFRKRGVHRRFSLWGFTVARILRGIIL